MINSRIWMVLMVLILSSLGLLYPRGCKAAKEMELATSVSLYNHYIWRGFEYSRNSMVIQPSVTASSRGFSLNLWSNIDTHETYRGGFRWNETDLTISYDLDLGPASLSLGYLYYLMELYQDSQEIYTCLSFHLPLNPSITVYREIAHTPLWYINLALSQDISLPKGLSLEMGFSASYLASRDQGSYPEYKWDDGELVETNKRYKALHDGLAWIHLEIPFSKVTLTPEIYYSFPLSNKAKRIIKAWSVKGDQAYFLFGGATVSYSF